MWSPVDDITCFEDVEYSVDTSSWYEKLFADEACQPMLTGMLL